MAWTKLTPGSAIGARSKHGAVGDAKTCLQGFVRATDLTRFNSTDVGKFTNDSVGKVISIPYAGVIDAGKTIPKAHVTTIKSYISSSVVELTNPAPTPNDAAYTVVGASKVLGGFAVWGTPNQVAFQNWMNDCSSRRKPGELEPADAEGYLVLPNAAHVNVVGGAAMVWPNYCHIKGFGEAGSIIYAGGNALSVFRYDGQDNVFVIDPQMDEIVVDMAGVSESTYTTTTKAIYLTHWKHGRFENNTLRNSPATAFGCDFPVDGCGVRGNRIIKGGRQVDELGGSAGGSGFGIGTGKYLYEELDLTNNSSEDAGFNNYFLEAQTTPNPLARGYRVIGNVSLRGKYGFAENGTQGSIFALNQAYDATIANYRIFKAFTNRYGKEVEFVNNKAIGGNQGLEVNSGDGHWTWVGGEIAYGTGNGVTITDTGSDAGVAPHPTNMRIIDVNIHDMQGWGVRVIGTNPPAAFGSLSILGGRINNIGIVGTRRSAVCVDRPCDVLRVKDLRVTDDRAAGAKGISYGLELTAAASIGELQRIDNDFPVTGPNALGDGDYHLVATTPPALDRFRTLP